MSEVKLYGPPLAPFTEKVRLALLLKKLEFELIEPQSPEDYREWSPETGLLPVADIDGRRVADSSRILDVLDERYPETPLVSSDPTVANSQRRLEDWASETMFFYWERFLREEAEAQNESAAPERGLARFGILRPRSGPSSAERYGAEFEQCIADLANFLGTRPYFYSDTIGRADLTVYTFFAGLGPGGTSSSPAVARALAKHPNLIALLKRVAEETGVASADATGSGAD